ncbi:MAG TPA: hypothetical protein VK586_24220 [Streptosporangiaceae bacterium]|nr:hypothetical protein [Streptosporangiaceae bacterium]
MTAPAGRLRLVHSAAAPAGCESGVAGLLAAVGDFAPQQLLTLVAWAIVGHPETVRGALASMQAVERESRAGIATALRLVPAPPVEITVGWGDDTTCAACCCPLPAGAPAWPDSDGRLSCVDCTAAEAAAERGR